MKCRSFHPDGAAAGKATVGFDLPGDLGEQFRRRARISIDKDKPIATATAAPVLRARAI